MKRFRRILFWLHLVAGIAAGVVILVMSVTGVLLAFERQMVEAADSLAVPPPPQEARRLPLRELVEAAAAAGSTPTAITLWREPDMPVTAALGRDRTVLLNPWTGEILEAAVADRLRAFFRKVTDVHRWLAMEGDGRTTGRAITGAANAVFLFLVFSGLYLWFPRRWSLHALRAIVLPRRHLQGKARDFNLHNAFGFWSCVPLAAIVATAMLISYPWATALLYRAAGESPPPPRQPGRESPAARGSAPAGLPDPDAALAAAQARMPGWETISLRLPPEREGLVFTLMGSHRGRPDLRMTVTVDPATAGVIRQEEFADYSPARRWRTWARWIHTGEAGGFRGQLVAALVSAAACLLVWTGFALTWRRFRGRRARRTPGTAGADGLYNEAGPEG